MQEFRQIIEELMNHLGSSGGDESQKNGQEQEQEDREPSVSADLICPENADLSCPCVFF